MTTPFSTLLGLLLNVLAMLVAGTYLLFLWKAIKEDGINLREMGQVTLILLLIFMVGRDAFRDHEWTYFSETIYLFLIMGLSGLAGIKQWGDVSKFIKSSPPKNERSEKADEEFPTP